MLMVALLLARVVHGSASTVYLRHSSVPCTSPCRLAVATSA